MKQGDVTTMFKIATLINTLAIVMALGSAGETAAAPSSMRIIGAGSPPIGHVQFCEDYPEECAAYAAPSRMVRLTEVTWHQLEATNLAVNTAVLPATDMQIFGVVERWDFPRLAGDCEDYALEKRRELIDRGWPASALLMTVVRDEAGDGHAILTVRTDRGDLVLDNKTDEILLWSDTAYTFLKRQSARNGAEWDQIADGRAPLVGSVR